MLGRTHRAIGAGAACVLIPFALHTGGTSVLHDIAVGDWQSLITSAEFIVASVIGSVVPDLDESHSLLAQKVELLGRLLLLIAIIGLTLGAHMSPSPLGWIAWALLAFSLLTRANWARKVALLALAVGALYASGVIGGLTLAGSIGLAIWCVGAAFTAHRTWTHSVLGLACLLPAATWMMNHGLSVWAIGFLMGYVLHLLADSVSGGVPIFYPLGRKRIGLRLVYTGGWADHAVAVTATGIAVVALLL